VVTPVTYRPLAIKVSQLKICGSIQINHQPDATIFQFIILTFVYSSTCFGRFPAHHQELNDCSGSLWYYLRIVVRSPTEIVGSNPIGGMDICLL
jgi:hypothetical protein